MPKHVQLSTNQKHIWPSSILRGHCLALPQVNLACLLFIALTFFTSLTLCGGATGHTFIVCLVVLLCLILPFTVWLWWLSVGYALQVWAGPLTLPSEAQVSG